jgi:hypothetical protein
VKESEATLVVAKICSYDARMRPRDKRARDAMVEAWQEALSDLLLADCLAAVAAHYRDSAEWIMQAHVRERVAAVRRARLAKTPLPDIPAEVAARPRLYAAAVDAGNAAIMDGGDPVAAIAEVTGLTRAELER